MKMKGKKVVSINFILVVVILSVFFLSLIGNNDVKVVYVSEVKAIYRGDEKKNNVSLMFNVYENTDIVKNIIRVLNENNVKATFFVGGCWADDNEETLSLIRDSGNEIGNHGYFHKDHKKLDYTGNKNEIYNTYKIVKELSGVETKLFAPPSGSFSSVTLDTADDLGYKIIMWSKDTIDWRDNEEEKIISRATKNLSNGDLILMHPKPHTLNALNSIISIIIDKGFNIVSVGENIGLSV
ncbi:MAG: polysaccharide deacetylase family protein [Clostridia bacterium]|nr:polysaccharide deacetylase family protein [Clostridia bacterium]